MPVGERLKMKHTTLLMILLASALSFPQTTDPVILELRRSSATAVNASAKEIVYIAVKVTTERPRLPPQYSYSARDFFFSESGLGPTETMEIVHDEPANEPYAKVQLTFVQFADGSTWGEADEFSAETLKLRKPKVDFCERALAAYSRGGAPALTAQLESESRFFIAEVRAGDVISPEDDVKQHLAGEAKGLLRIQEQAGTEAVLKKLRHKVAAAQSRQATMKFSQ
jgi:hypothetical protein